MSSRLPQPEVYQLTNGNWSWRIVSPNGEPIVQAHEPDGFDSRRNARENFELAKSIFVALWHQDRSEELLQEAVAVIGAPPNGIGAHPISQESLRS